MSAKRDKNHTPEPRTKAFMAELSSRCDDWSWFAQKVEDFARQLERELAAEKAKVAHRPSIFTLCRHCNQEFKLTSQEYVSFMDCPHCSKRVDIWLRIGPPAPAPANPPVP